MHSRFRHLLLALLTVLALPAWADLHGVINDPDGFTNVRAKQNADSAIVGKVLAGEVFEFTAAEGGFATWVKVKLPGGKSGWMHASRVRLHATLDELADTGPNDEINVYGKHAKIDYYPLARSAARGEAKGLQRYFAIDDTDGAAAETHYDVLRKVAHLLGDEKLAKFLSTQPAKYRANVYDHLSSELASWPFEPKAYLERNFPKTAKVLKAR
jgi:hypothetical protein